jgi:hypothetical protein
MLDLTSKAMLVASIRNRLFASRDTVDDALNYAVSAIDRLVTSDDRAAMYTALHVVMNTVADKIDALPDSSAAVLEPPPAEVRIDHADLPATGAGSLHDQIEDIVLAQISELGRSIDKKIDRAIAENLALIKEEWNEETKSDTIIEEWFGNNWDIIDERITEVVRNMSFTVEVD